MIEKAIRVSGWPFFYDLLAGYAPDSFQGVSIRS